ncbi:MAG: HEAT repeat domain-containing protein [bacterium]|nr:HEAT repeat domain-containing protein [bacterium]
MLKGQSIIVVLFLLVLSSTVWAEGIRDEIFYLNKDSNLSINEDNFNRLKKEESSALIEILVESKEDHPIKTILGEMKVSVSAKNEIILKLAEFADKGAKDIIEWYLEHSTDRFNRHIAAVSLGAVGDNTSIEKLKTVIKDPDPALQLYAARALGELGDTSGYELAMQYLKKNDEVLKTQAIYALAMINKPEAIPLLKQELDNKDYREVARLAISKIEYDHLTVKKKSRYLRKLLQRESGETVYWAATEFMKLGREYMPELKNIAQKKKYPGISLIKQALAEKESTINDQK